MQQRLFALGRARGVHAAVSDLIFRFVDSAAALRTIRGHPEFFAVGTLFDHFQHMRDHFAGALDQHGVADLQSQAINLVHIVERGTADGDASDLHWLKHGYWRQRPSPSDLDTNVVHDRGLLPRGIFVGDGPARRFRRETQFMLNPRRIDLDHHAVDFIRQIGPLRLPRITISNYFFNAIAKLPIV